MLSDRAAERVVPHSKSFQYADDAYWTNRHQRALFVERNLLLLDNQRSTFAQAECTLAWLSRMPAERVPLRALTILEYLGGEQPALSLDGKGYKVNVFGVAPGAYSEQPFPINFSGWRSDLFAQVAAHEITHVLDSAYIEANPERRARRAALLADAGNDPQNFLRNLPQFPSGWFQQNPLEFIASIANQWVAESQICLQLGREKLGFGRRQPMEQALFFADMLSTGNTVPFFRCGTSGVIQSRTATLGRDAQGRIISITDGGVRLDIVYDAQGHVASATQTAQDCDGEEPFQQAARSSKFDSFRSMSVRYIQLRAELLPYGKKLADGVATPEERRVHNRIEEAMGAEFRRLNRYMWDNRWTDEDRAAMGWILYGAQQPK